MSWLVFCFTITILINNVSPLGPYTLIPGDTTWTDTIDNTDPNYQQTYTDAGTGDGDYWFYPEYRSDRANDQGGLAGITGTVPGTGEEIWGWWNFWGQTIDGTWTEDPDRAMVRYFTCGSYGTVDISFNFWMCNEGYTPGNNRPNGMSSNTVVTMRRTSLTQGTNILYRRYDHSCWSDYSSNPANNPYGYDPSGVQCTNQVRRCQVSESFDTGGINYGASGDTIVLKVTWESNAQGDGNSWHTAGMNNLQITCNRTPTNAPTISPTVTTATPTKTPSVTPSVTPTESPTPAPTGNPTRNPTTYDPTKSPTTPIPSKSPSKHPTPDPTQSPTIDPTNDPTPKPTVSPNAQPTDKPTPKRSLGEQFAGAFGGESECTDSWIVCNIVVFIILLLLVICCILYWILGSVWYKRRQDNRPLPPYLMNQEQGGDNVEMGAGTGTGGVQTHATSNKWKSQWELEQEAKAQQGGGNDGDGW